MDKSVTMSVKGLVVTGLVVLGLVVAYLLGDSGSGAEAAPAPAAAEPADERTLTMAGTGEATAVPDQLGFTLSVRTTRPAWARRCPPATTRCARCWPGSPSWGSRSPTSRPPDCR